jgi:hypothetical protein
MLPATGHVVMRHSIIRFLPVDPEDEGTCSFVTSTFDETVIWYCFLEEQNPQLCHCKNLRPAQEPYQLISLPYMLNEQDTIVNVALV